MVERVQKSVLGNGLTVLLDPKDTNDVVALVVGMRIGCAEEDEGQAGISALTLHLLLKGTAARTSEQVATEIESLGARLSTNSGRDFGTVSLVATRETFSKAISILYDILLNPAFPVREVEVERELTLQRIAAREDQMLSKAMDLANEAYYGDHPYHRPPLGYPETVRNLSRDEIERFYRTHFVPRGTVIAAVGGVDPEELRSSIDSALGHIPDPGRGASHRASCAPVDILGPREKLLTRDIKAAWISIACGAPSITEPDYPATEVMESIMGGSMSSRLFAELRDRRGLAYQVGCVYSARPGPSVFVSYIGTKGDQYAIATDGITEELRKIRDEVVTQEELLLARRYITGTFIMGQERNISRASMLAQYELLGLGYAYADLYPKLIEQVTAEEVQLAAAKYLDIDSRAIGAVVPGKQEVLR